MEFPDLSAFQDNIESISFHVEEIDFVFPETEKAIKWLNQIAKEENKQIVSLEYVFCDDEYLHKINLKYLDHDTYTDIITFDLGNPDDDLISGEIYISIERVKENTSIHNSTLEDELRRVVAHGLLHLIGYPDKSVQEASVMRAKENAAIQSYKLL